jgi:cytochrome c oxidase cbb3-type subunit 4
MYKEVLRSIEDIEIMPMISLMVFMLFFIGMFIWVVTVDRKYVEHMRSLPLNDNEIKEGDDESK